MPAQEPHPGKWDFVLGPNQCELNTVRTAVHSCLTYNQSTGIWKVLYFTGFPEENSIIRSRIWNPTTNQITSQTVPNWPGTGQPLPIIFCSGHSFMADGKLLVAGGSKEGQQLGLKFTYIFNSASETWSVAINPTTGQPQPMADGRYYPTLTALGEDPLYGRILAVTHSLDMDQRSIGLSFTPGPLNHGYPYTVTAPPNANIAPPGLYMLFVLRPKAASSSGQTMIPSIAKIVRLQKP